MTVQTLFDDVLALGFDDTAEMSYGFLYAARRAQRTVALEWGRESRARILAVGTDAISSIPLLKHAPGEVLTVKASGATAYSMKLSGSGSYSVKDGKEEKKSDFSSRFLTRRGFIGKDGALVFSGDGSFTAFDIAFFRIPESEGAEAIPIYYSETDYCLPDLIDDFLAPTSIPTSSDGTAIDGARICADTLTLPSEFTGEVNIFYKRMPREISLNPTQAVDIPRIAEHLLPILTAAYLWLEDSPDKAQYYMQIYREATEEARRRLPKAVGGEYKNVTGWA